MVQTVTWMFPHDSVLVQWMPLWLALYFATAILWFFYLRFKHKHGLLNEKDFLY